MERFLHSAGILWRSERMLAEQQLKVGVRKASLGGLAALIAVIGLVMLSLAVFFALAPVWGQALAALSVGVLDLLIAGGLAAYAQSLRPTEIEVVKQVRDMALRDIEDEAAIAQGELEALRDEARDFIRNPMDTLLPAAVNSVVSSFLPKLGRKRR